MPFRQDTLLMTTDTMRHPAQLTALVIVRSSGQLDQRGYIRSAAAFHVTRTREGPTFAIGQRAYSSADERGDVIADILSSVPTEATLLIRSPKVTRRERQHLYATGTLPAADIQLLPGARPALNMLPLEISDRTLSSVAENFAVPRANHRAPLDERARRAADEAQVLWLAYLWSMCGPTDRTSLTSAWQAWTALQRARPLPF